MEVRNGTRLGTGNPPQELTSVSGVGTGGTSGGGTGLDVQKKQGSGSGRSDAGGRGSHGLVRGTPDTSRSITGTDGPTPGDRAVGDGVGPSEVGGDAPAVEGDDETRGRPLFPLSDGTDAGGSLPPPSHTDGLHRRGSPRPGPGTTPTTEAPRRCEAVLRRPGPRVAEVADGPAEMVTPRREVGRRPPLKTPGVATQVPATGPERKTRSSTAAHGAPVPVRLLSGPVKCMVGLVVLGGPARPSTPRGPARPGRKTAKGVSAAVWDEPRTPPGPLQAPGGSGVEPPQTGVTGREAPVAAARPR